MTNAPLVSIIMAAYGRPKVLRWAVESVMAQTFEDWELLVVGDACEAATQSVVAALAERDLRIRFINLARNYGEQSGPNNVGIARSRGRYLAFLNQDDLWFPDHLQVAIDWLEASGSDLIFTLCGVIAPSSREDLERGEWIGGIGGIGRRGHYDPATTFAPASTWLLKRTTAEKIGPWLPAIECIAETSQNFLFRAWRRGTKLSNGPELTAIIFSSAGRPNSYQADQVIEQEWFFHRMRNDPSFRTQVLARVGYRQPLPRTLKARLVAAGIAAREWLLRAAGLLGWEPRGLAYRFRHRVGRGGYINLLRRRRGLEVLPAGPSISKIKAAAARKACQYQPGVPLQFSKTGRATAHQLNGWSLPENWGAWTEGEEARLLFELPPPADCNYILTITAHTLITPKHPFQKIEILVNDQPVVCYKLTKAELTRVQIPIDRELLAGTRFLEIALHLPDCVAPAEQGMSKDWRRLGLAVKELNLLPATGALQGMADSE